MRARVREGVRRTHPLLIDFVELTRALHLNFEMMLLPLLLLKIDLKSVKPTSQLKIALIGSKMIKL